jgi:hypothetical protein
MVWTVAVLGCGSSPEQQAPVADAAGYDLCSVSRLTLPLTETGGGGQLAAAVVDAAPNPPAKHDNVWMLELLDANGARLEDAEISFVETFMPVHEHAGVPAPTAERTESARFRLRVPFMMRGPWEVRLDLVSQRAGTDRIVFDVCVAE